jgi:cytoskeletal protein CcmA (bactofilin family)
MPKPPEPPLAALLGAGSDYSGDMRFEGRVRVDGRFRGRLVTEDALEVGPDGFVDGEADVLHAVVSGHVKGKLHVRELLVVESTGRVEGLVDAHLLEVRSGASISGEIRVAGRER